MRSTGTLVRRWLAVILLAALFGGPAGIAGTLHPIDDGACAPTGNQGAGRGEALESALPDIPHCPTCHLLRSLRFGVLEALDPAETPVASPTITSQAARSPLRDLIPALPGRSPPLLAV